MTIRFRSMLAAAALASLSGAALAHPGHAPASFATGFAHPLGGLDHLLAMLTVGLFAARQAGATRAMPSSAAMRWAPAFCMKFSSVQVRPESQ